MVELLSTVRDWISLGNSWFWLVLVGLTTLAWLAVRGFAGSEPLRRKLSLALSLFPVALAVISLVFSWEDLGGSVTFERPGYLLLLGLLPLLVFFGIRSLSGLGPVRQTLAIALRGIILALVITALAEMQLVQTASRLSVLFAIDHSRSIPQERVQRIRAYVDRVIREKPSDDLAGVIYFSKTAQLEIPPSSYLELHPPEGEHDRLHTDLSAAIKLAQASFPEDTMKRILLISDGNETRGAALAEAGNAGANGIAIDVLPIRYRYDQEVQVEKVAVTPEAHKGETINLNILVRSSAPISGTLRLFQLANNRTELLAEQHVELRRGVNLHTVPYKVNEANFYNFKAIFDPDDPSQDWIAQNNQAESFTHAEGAARVLLIEGTRGEHDSLVKALRQENIEVDQRGPDQLPSALPELRPYHSVILANLPREELSDRQMEMLVANTRELGAGLVMIGGPDSFGAGGYIDTPIEKAMPVDMQIKSLKVVGKGALVLVMHACEIPQGNYWEKKICRDAIMTLSSSDEAGIVQSNGAPSWVFPLQRIGNKKRLLARLDRLTPQDMRDFDPTLLAARNALMASDALTKHVILVSDGDPRPPSPPVVRSLKNAKITVTTVGVAVHGNAPSALRVMRNLAKATDGRFYHVLNNNMLPKIFQKEARIVSRPLIFERPQGWTPRIVAPSEPIAGLSATSLPPIRGFVLTTAKENELVSVPIQSPLPAGIQNPLLAHWVFGLGKAVAFTSDAGTKWTTDWTGWENYRKFWAQLVRWSMRSVEGGSVRISTQLVDGKIKVIADVLDKENEFVNFAIIRGGVLDPGMQTSPLELLQVAPGRYEGIIEKAEDPGTHFIYLDAQLSGSRRETKVTGVTVPYPAEFRDLEDNHGLLETIASVSGGQVITEQDAFRNDPDVNPFRHDLNPPPAMQDLWSTLVFLAVILFLFDVAVRRIALDLSRVRPAMLAAWGYVRGRQAEPAQSDYMSKLRGRKAEVTRQLDRAHRARRFEPSADAALASDVVSEHAAGGAAPPKTKPAPQVAPQPPSEPEETYTSRLLKAKQKVWKDKKGE